MSEDNTQISSLASVIRQGARNALLDTHTAMPGIVSEFDPATQLASVQPVVRRLFIEDDGETSVAVAEDLPPCVNVPVAFPRGGGCSMTFPVAPGDECLLIFCERDYALWHARGEVSDPGSHRMHDYSDSVAILGVYSSPRAIADFNQDGVEIRRDDGAASILITDQNVSISADIKITATAPELEVVASTKVTLTAPLVETSANLTVGGDLGVVGATNLSNAVTSGGTNIGGTHNHTGSPSAPTGLVTPTGPPI